MFSTVPYQCLTYSVRCKLRSQLTQLRGGSKCQQTRKVSSLNDRKLVLGIETSCDDTGAAVVDDQGNILGNCLNSQTATSVEMGGVIPVQAQALHVKHIDSVVKQAMHEANVGPRDLDAVAVTTEPGLALSLSVGVSYAKSMVQEHRLPLIPIHHMQAHALTARMVEKIDFPFLVLLMSGGHCLLAVAKEVDEFLLLGTCEGKAPGEVMDKIARRLKLKTLPECRGMSGGAMIEHMALLGDPYAYSVTESLMYRKDCDFCFSGIKGTFNKLVEELEEEQGIEGVQVINNVADVCASLQFILLRHIMKRLQRCFMFCDYQELLPERKTLVVSGGVACNKYFRSGLQNICDQYNSSLICPPSHLCTDNGIMIAWNGMEKVKVGRGFADDPEAVRFTPKKPIGKDLREEVSQTFIKTRPILTVDHVNYF